MALSSAADVEGHKGIDGEYYLLDFSRFFLLFPFSFLLLLFTHPSFYRTMPPVQPDKRYINGHIYYLFRKEFVRSYPKPLCSDAFSG